MKLACLSILLTLGAGTGPAIAQTGQVYSLTDEQKAQVRDANRAGDVSSGQLPDGGADRQIHGEGAATIGTGGARSLGGTAAIPLGQNGGAVVSVESSRFNDRPYRWR